MDKIIDNAIIDPYFSSYEKFFDHDWAATILAAVKDSTLENAVNGLMVAWRSTNGAHILPSHMVESLRRYAESKMEASLHSRERYSELVIEVIAGTLVDRMQCELTHEQTRSLKLAVAEIEGEVRKSMKSNQQRGQFDVAQYWESLVNHSEFRFSILGTQRINYGALFFAYEDFIANVIRTKDFAYTSKGANNQIDKVFPKHFGTSLGNLCWNDDEVQLAKLVRNALVHNGGRFGEDLEKFRSRFVTVTQLDNALLCGEKFNLVNNKIQIMPDNTRYLFCVLKERVTRIVDEVK
ncbi:hypothetical protein [Tuwongella immobilis]|uniref:Uncharacterized protein n=1 Tax=Tuwongella immobilis TaxID=692036 RepID=A0A6C2YJ40_9BACT|nr:hypothetical protein [Tuwongella immobilis]VIP01153.1 Uncharacterized protein OS=Planctomyces brasiliensis (strain ATCC 49424 / DSM 5305 / JCM 21570 / NBRC 103401 / IFAM 1448) GN=Plabr_1048 PE=4 SV=1 [Tuwongella immobilis]VTR97732.1 Uncharacterized protein OS=Planctomyces brasiliensis (strain ATCC 49424 / DSM 5305 / JCM 21570 / NBRC 103401 / IFAM 1448) GN=Plabr_1048 PE=4 SV=1 [Tuwongella immobilis]